MWFDLGDDDVRFIVEVRQNQLVWAGKSKTTDAKTVEKLVAEVSAATADELNRLMLISR